MTLEIWEKFNRPPAFALKTIRGGRTSGMTDISPQWRYLAMTDIFGPCGIGWKFEVTKQWLENGSDGNIAAFVNINLYIKQDDKWSEPIPGNGGSSFVSKEKGGLYTSDECYKMATTDALSTAMKMLGVAADIYLGAFDGSKYKDLIPKTLNEKQISEITDMMNEKIKVHADFFAWLNSDKGLNISCVEQIPAELYGFVKSTIMAVQA